MAFLLNRVLIEDAFLYLSSRLPEKLTERDKGYLEALQHYKRHLESTLKDIN